MTFQPAPDELKKRVHEFMEKNRGKLYHRIPHPDFDGLPVAHGDERFDIIKPHLAYPGGTVLDIGTHWGQFAHWLDDLGYHVTAVEHAPKYAYIARGIRDICNKEFEIIEGSIFNVNDLKFDIVLALNIFHHFLKTEKHFEQLLVLLEQLDAPLMFFQSHVPTEKQMEGAYRNMDQDDFAEFVRKTARYSRAECIGKEGPRNIYKMSRE
jgi:2-polyprenyl-3-methyl-5-hydroxy-6-metoxy-1,4-benzoquinol methylase